MAETKKAQSIRSKKRPAKNRPARERKTAPGSTPLPAPVEIQAVQQEPKSEASNGGLFGGMFQSNPDPSPNPESHSGNESQTFSTSNYDAEAQRLLDAVPDYIGAEPDEAGAAAPADVQGTAAALGVVSADTLASILQTAFGFVADWRRRDVYRLDDSKAAVLAGPWCPVVNDWWAKFAPAFLAQWSMANPGLFAAVLTTAVTVGPMIQADLKQSAAERSKRGFVRAGTSHNGPAPAAAAPAAAAPAGGMFYDMGEAA
jgi:hypothetical protein